MGQTRETDRNRVAIRICPKCAKAFFALESEDAVCVFCGMAAAGTSAGRLGCHDLKEIRLGKNVRR